MTKKKVTKKQTRDRLIAVIEAIQADPKSWNQVKWHCGTTHCFAGFADLHSGAKIVLEPNPADYANTGLYNTAKNKYHKYIDDTEYRAIAWLGITQNQADDLFNGGTSFHELYLTVLEIISEPEIKEHEFIKSYPDLRKFIK